MKKIDSLEGQKSLSLGFIGGGASSAIGQTHFGASRLDGRWRLNAGAFSRNIETNHKTSEMWHVSEERVYKTWQRFIAAEKDKLDAVVVLTPTPVHSEIVCALLNERVPVICEKPLASSLEEAKLIREAFQNTQNFLAVIYNYSGYPMVRELRELIRQGNLGQLHKFHFEMPQEVFLRVPGIAGRSALPHSWRLEDGVIPTICLDLGVHLHHLAVFLTGEEPVRTMAEFSNHSKYSGLVDDVMMWIEYQDGMKGSFWMSKTALGHRNGLKLSVFGEKGSAEWCHAKPEQLMVSDTTGTITRVDRGSETLICGEPRYNRYRSGHPSGFVEAFANLYSDIADALIAYRETGSYETPYVFGLDHSVDGLRLFTSAQMSNNERIWKEIRD